MARGGSRPGAGRPKKGDIRLPKEPRVRQSEPKTNCQEPAKTEPPVGELLESSKISPLEYLLSVMRAEDEDPDRRDRAAALLLPYLHVKAGGAGKKEQRHETAKSGRFAPPKAPTLVINNR